MYQSYCPCRECYKFMLNGKLLTSQNEMMMLSDKGFCVSRTFNEHTMNCSISQYYKYLQLRIEATSGILSLIHLLFSY